MEMPAKPWEVSAGGTGDLDEDHRLASPAEKAGSQGKEFGGTFPLSGTRGTNKGPFF